MIRRRTREVPVGTITIGGDHPVAVQTMWDAPVTDPDGVLKTLYELAASGCHIIRFSVPDEQSLEPLKKIFAKSPMPVVADIHFDYRLAAAAIEAGAAKIRINPGNIGAWWKVDEIIDRAQDKGCAIRIGVNGGSLPGSFRGSEDHAASMLEVISSYIEHFEKRQFEQLVVSLKDSRIETCYRVNAEFARQSDIPLHLGVTEAGTVIPALVRSTLVLGDLLREGIGDTLRISITGSIFDEVAAAKELLRSCGRSTEGIQLISCPRCGRATFDTHAFTASIEKELQKISEPVTVAVMGCVVNGPGEAKLADIGITGAADEILIFRAGKIIKRVRPEEAREVFLRELEAVINETYHH